MTWTCPTYPSVFVRDTLNGQARGACRATMYWNMHIIPHLFSSCQCIYSCVAIKHKHVNNPHYLCNKWDMQYGQYNEEIYTNDNIMILQYTILYMCGTSSTSIHGLKKIHTQMAQNHTPKTTKQPIFSLTSVYIHNVFLISIIASRRLLPDDFSELRTLPLDHQRPA